MARQVPATTTALRCPLCGKQRDWLYGGLVDRLFSAPGVWNLRRCDTCAIAWLDPQPAAEDISLLYETYYTHAQDAVDSAGAPGTLQNALLRAVLAGKFGYRELAPTLWLRFVGRVLGLVIFISDRVGARVMWLSGGRRGRLLDVGCGSGALMERMDRLGWTVTGVEPDPVAAASAQARGLEVHVGTLDSAQFAPGSFDAISLHHVLEHLPAPEEAIATCSELLDKDGVLVVATPNLESLGHKVFGPDWRGLEVPRHLRLYSRSAIRSLLVQNDLSVRSIRTSSRIAAAIWGTSRWLQKHPGERLHRGMTGERGLGSMLFKLVETIGAGRRDAGEELVVIAKRD